MAEASFRAWLSRQPYPATLLCEMADGSEKTVRLGVTRSKFRDAETACAGAAHVEARDESGAVLRVIDLELPPDAKSKAALAAPDPLVRFAELLAQASDASAQRHENAYRMAFEHMAALVGTISTRLASLEKAWHTLIMSQTPPEGESASGTDALAAQAIGLLLAGKGNAPPNGAKEKESNG